MKRTALLVVLLAIVASLFALPASAKSSGPSMAQFNALKSKITGLQGQVRSLQGQLSCLTPYPITSYGDGVNGTHGYLYGAPDGTVFATTGLDWVYDTSGLTAGTDFFWVAGMNPGCVSTSGRTTASAGMSPRAHQLAKHASSEQPARAWLR